MKLLMYAVGEGAITGLSPAAAAEIKEFRESMKFVAEILEKASKGENPLIVPGAKDKTVERMLQFKKAVEIIENVMSAAKSASPEGMKEHLKKCSAPIPEATFRSAEKYVMHLGAAMEQLPKVQKLFNDMASKDDECLQRQVEAYTACVKDAECRGVSASKCDSLKPPGDWVDPK